MRNRILAVGAFFACALTLRAQQQPSLYKVELAAGASMVALGPPVIVGNNYAFSAWPDGGSDRAPVFGAARGYRTAHWTQAGMTHWVISDLNEAEFQALVRVMQRVDRQGG